MKAMALLALALVLSGCATIRRTELKPGTKVGGYDAIESVEIRNTNWLLLTLLPIGSGDPDNPNGWTTCLFQNTATLDNQLKMLDAEAKRVGASRAVDVASVTSDETVLILCFLREKYHTTAVLVK